MLKSLFRTGVLLSLLAVTTGVNPAWSQNGFEIVNYHEQPFELKDLKPLKSFKFFDRDQAEVPTPVPASGYYSTVPYASIVSDSGVISQSYFEQANLEKCKVTGLKSGDTFYCLDTKTKNKYTIKLEGIYAPRIEKKPFGPITKRQLASLIEGKEVLVQPHASSGDTIRATVYAQQQNINLLMLATGCALIEEGFDAYDPELASVQDADGNFIQQEHVTRDNYECIVRYAEHHFHVIYNPLYINAFNGEDLHNYF